MKLLIDATILDDYLFHRGGVRSRLRDRLYEGDDIFIDGMAYFEVLRGLVDLDDREKIDELDRILGGMAEFVSLHKEIFETASEIFVNLKRKDSLPGVPGKEGKDDADILIGATAQVFDYTIVTKDSDFDQMDSVSVEKW